MRVVAHEREVLVAEVEQMTVTSGLSSQSRQRARLAGELQSGLLEVVAVEVGVAEGVDEVAGLEAA